MPRPPALALCLCLCPWLSAAPAVAAPCPEAARWQSALRVGDTSMAFGADPDYPQLTVYGLLHNAAEHDFENPVIEARLLDETGQMIDTLADAAFGLVVPASGQASFRLQGVPAQDFARYAGLRVRLTRAQARIDCEPPPPPPPAPTWQRALPLASLPLAVAALLLAAIAVGRRRETQRAERLAPSLEHIGALLDRQADAQQRLALAADQLSAQCPPAERAAAAVAIARDSHADSGATQAAPAPALGSAEPGSR